MGWLLHFFFLRRIYLRRTKSSLVSFYGIGGALLATALYQLTGGHEQGLRAYMGLPLLIVAVYAYFLMREVLRENIATSLISSARDLPARSMDSSANILSIDDELNGTDLIKVVKESSNVALYYAVFNFHRTDKYGNKYLTKQAYYTVYKARLSRILPHVLFDSKAAKGRQFKYSYLSSQRISVQGGFDEQFDTYVPDTYHIDALSFVSPEVMEVIMEARDYDIEIIGDQLLLYGPLLTNDGLRDIESKGTRIAHELNDNIDTYRDSRLPYTSSRSAVTSFGRALLKNPAKFLPVILISGLGILGVFYFASITSYEVLMSYPAVFAYASFAVGIYKYYEVSQENKRAEQAFYYLHKTNRGRPLKH